MEKYGLVTDLVAGDRAMVKVRRHLSCGSCGRCGGFFGDPEKNLDEEVEVINSIGARAGDLVRMESNYSEMLLAAFLLYITPLLGLLAGLFAGRSWAISRGLAGSPDIWGLVSGLVLMAAVFVFLRRQERRLDRGSRFKAKITAVVTEEDIPEDMRLDGPSTPGGE